MTIKYSVIIPHKNSVQLLARCLGSIPQREDVEVIVVDDNSAVSSVEWEDFRTKYPYARLFLTHEGKGAGYARNVGLGHAQGEWLIFSDADDYFYPGSFDVIDKFVTANDADITYFLCDSRDGETGELIPDRVPNIRRGIERKDLDLLRYRSYIPCGKVIRRELVETHHIRFEEVEVSNDIMFSTLVGYYVQKVGIIDTALYCITKNKNSLFFGLDSRRAKIRIEAAVRVNDFLYQKGVKHRYYPHNYTFFFFPNHPLEFIKAVYKCRYKGQTKKYIKEVWRGMRREWKNRHRING